MNSIVYHIATGHAFFSGLCFVCLAVACCLNERTKRLRVAGLLVGVTAIALSSTPLAYWFYAVGIVIAGGWLFPLEAVIKQKTANRLLVAWCLMAALIELPHHRLPRVDKAGDRTLIVVGDSVTAGMGGSDTTKKWPEILREEHGIAVQDLSHPGATASSAVKRVHAEKPMGSVVLFEIGGNDVLGTTTTTEFETDLRELVKSLSVPGRQLVMLELPLVPLYHEYGRIQRTIAKQYDMALVPKAHFLSVIAHDRATVDSIHLTQHGHRLMANKVWQVVGPAFRERPN